MPESLVCAPEKRGMRMVWKTLRIRHLGLAFFWACSMLTFRSSILLSGPLNTTGYQTLVVLVSFIANMTTLFAIASRTERNRSFCNKLPASAFTASIVLGLVLMAGSGAAGGAGLLTEQLAAAVLMLGSVLVGIGYGFFWGSWAETLGCMHPSRTSFYLPAVLLLTALLFVAFSFCSEKLGVPALALMLPLPLISQLCLTRCNREEVDTQPEIVANTERYRSAFASLVSLIVATLVVSCLFGYVWQITVVSVGSTYTAHWFPLVANVVAAAALIALVLFAHRRTDLALTFKAIVPVLVVLFVLMPIFWSTHPVGLNTVISACYGVFDVIIWYMVASTAYDFSVSGFVVGGIVRAVSLIARLVGIGIGYVVMLNPGSTSLLVVGVSVGAVYVLAMLVLFQPGSKRLSFLNFDTKTEKGAANRTATVSCTTEQGEAKETAHTTHRKNNCENEQLNQQGIPTNQQISSSRQQASPGTQRTTLPKQQPTPANPQITPPNYQPASTDRQDADLEQQTITSAQQVSPASNAQDDRFSCTPNNDVYVQIASYYGLTRREAEVLPYLARGRSAKVIAEALFVSESTVRTHIRRILEKTTLHSKQDLIDFIEKYE